MTETQAVAEWAWQRQSVWSQTADGLKAGPSRSRLIALVLTVSGGALALAGSQLQPVSPPLGRTLCFAAGTALGIVGLLRGLSGDDQIGRWVQARSVSEAMKSELFLFLTRSDRYASGNRELSLHMQVRRLEDDARDLIMYTLGIKPKVRTLPAVHDLSTYVEARLNQQISAYYLPRAATMRSRVKLFRMLEVALAVTAVVLTATAGAFAVTSAAAWASVVTALAATIAAHSAGERYEFLAIEYQRTGDELQHLRDYRSWNDCDKPTDAQLVERCETIISMQNDKWMAKWSGTSATPSSLDEGDAVATATNPERNGRGGRRT